MRSRLLLDAPQFNITIERLAHQVIESFDDFSEVAFLGLQPRGIYLSNRLKERLESILPKQEFNFGELDVTFHRDDFRRREEPLSPLPTRVDFSIENKTVVLIDDVLYTGRTIRAALDSLMDLGRPKRVELLVLIDRRFSRQLPIEADFIGRTIDSIDSERVDVKWEELDKKDEVLLYKMKNK